MWVFFWLVFTFVVAWWATKRGRLWLDYFLLALVLSPVIAGLILLIKPDLVKERKAYAEKRAAEAQREEERREDFERQLASIKELAQPRAPGSVADELVKLAGLRDAGVLTDDEFAAQKAALLAGRPAG